jgi:hypothetical protein
MIFKMTETKNNLVNFDLSVLLNEFVPFWESLELQKLGYNRPCIAWYYYPDDLRIFGQIPNDDFFANTENRPLAPTWKQAFTWIRETYGYEVSIGKIRRDRFQYEIFLRYTDDHEHHTIGSYFDSYDEAEVNCLRTLIEIIQNQLDTKN